MGRAALRGRRAVPGNCPAAAAPPKDDVRRPGIKPRNCMQTPSDDMDVGQLRACDQGLERVEGRLPAPCWPSRPARPGLCQLAHLNEKAQACRRSSASSSSTRPARRWTTRCTCAAWSTSTTTSASWATSRRQDLSERDQQASRDAYQAFKQLVEQFPASKYSARCPAAHGLHRQFAGPTKCTWRATTSAAAPTWPRPTAPSRRCRIPAGAGGRRGAATSWC
jgi:hypothetical protein